MVVSFGVKKVKMTINTSNCFFIFTKKKRQWKRYVSFRTPFLLVVSVVSFTLPFFTHFSLQVASFLALLFLQKFFSLFPTSICWSKITMHTVQTFLSVFYSHIYLFLFCFFLRSSAELLLKYDASTNIPDTSGEYQRNDIACELK